MLSHLLIKDFATIETIEVDFQKGLNIITGETGAGKSVVINAISMALGARADTTYVRTGCDKAVIQLLAEYGNREILITREISAAGKSLCKVDGQLVSLGELQQIARRIADIHGQYDHQYLLNPANHIKLVDVYEKSVIDKAKETVADLYHQYKDATDRLEAMKNEASDSDRLQDLMLFEIKEIRDANLEPGEDTRLEESLREMQHREEIYEGLGEAYTAAKESQFNASDALDRVLASLKPLSSLSKDASELEDEISDIYYRFEDIAARLRDARDNCVTSPEAYEMASDRLYAINKLKNKYADSIEGLLEYADTKEQELGRLKSRDSDIESLSLEIASLEGLLKDATAHLTRLRKQSAATLQEKIQEELTGLNFGRVTVIAQITEKENYTADGKDNVEFLISTNVGEDPKPLAKIISGGEMSRIMLAFKMIMADYDGIPTMIFDEIDAGISGETATLVGRAIKKLAERKQVITITHLPQMAAYGDFNYRITKSSDDAKTYTTILPLSDDEKAAEIARLIAGLAASDLTMQSAMEMIAAARGDN